MDRRAFLLAFFAAPLTGCGFRPLYGKQNREKFDAARIRITPIPNRSGQILHNALRDRLNPTGQPNAPTHNLKVTLTQTDGSLATTRGNNVRSYLDLTASFSFETTNRGPAIVKTSRTRRVYFADVSSATVVSQAADDARERGLQLLADDVARAVNLALLNRV